jgi:hypothetical protein
MSDCSAIYRKVKEFVKCLYPEEPRGFFQRNLNTLTSMITGIIIGKETQLPQIANNVPEDIKLLSTEKRFKRLIINPSVTEETFFLPFIKTLLNKLGLEEMAPGFRTLVQIPDLPDRISRVALANPVG